MSPSPSPVEVETMDACISVNKFSTPTRNDINVFDPYPETTAPTTNVNTATTHESVNTVNHQQKATSIDQQISASKFEKSPEPLKPRKRLSPEKTRALVGSGAVDPMTPEDLQKQNLDHGSPERR